jgi:hypothetical protein
MAFIMGLIIVLVLLNVYHWSLPNSPLAFDKHCISEFSINNWQTSPGSNLKSDFVLNNIVNGSINPNVTYSSSEQRKNYKKYFNYIVKSNKMASEIMNDLMLLNKIQESSMEALYQNWIIDRLSE